MLRCVDNYRCLRHSLAGAAWWALAVLVLSLQASALDPASVEAAVAVRRTAPGLLDAGMAVAKVPLSAAEIIRLPLGATELVLCPLPGITAVGGLKNIGAGALAPFKCAIDILALPHRVLNGLSRATGTKSK